MPEKRLAIIDGYSLLYRAFFATRFLSTADGRPTNALYGFTSMLFYLMEQVRPDAVVVALDAPGKTFRHAEFSEYKGTRKEIQPELKVQLPIARELIAALGIPTFEVPGYEADDVVGTISRKAEENGYNSTIVTGDLDTLQLVDECVSVLTMRQGVTDTVTYTPAGVHERYGFGPSFIPDYKALVGDTSDNIPGVPGIGAKGAADLIEIWGTIENLLDHLAEVEPKYRKKIEGNEEQLRKSKWLATIKTDAPVEYAFEPLQVSTEGFEQACATMESLEFKSLVRRAAKVFAPYMETGEGSAAPVAVVEVENERLEVSSADVSDFAALNRWVEGRPFGAFVPPAAPRTDLFDDTERTAYVAVGTEVRRAPESAVLKLIGENPRAATMHDAKPAFRRLPPGVAAPAFDTMLAGYVLQSGRSNYSVRDLIGGYLDIQLPETHEELTASLLPLRASMEDRLTREGQMRVLCEVELPLVPILADMENLGICADRENLREFSKELEVTIDQTQRRIFEMAECEFTIGSPKQLGEVLFEKMGIAGGQRTKTGYATGVEVLSLIPHPIAQEVLTWRELSKLKSTYADSLERLIGPDGRIHTNYNQTVAATGRLSSQDPNLQNIPIRTELGRGIRKAFHAQDGFVLGSFDYSQIELRVMAHMAREPALVQAFETGEDVHTVTASQMFGLPEAEISKQQRGYAKLLNYAVLYGVSEFGLAQQLGPEFSIAEAKALITQYNERFPSVKGFMGEMVQQARSAGFTTTMMGRRRYFPDIHTGKINERRATERQAMNAPIQGTAADMLKLAMIRCYQTLSGRASRMLLTVHDELVFELALGEEASLVEPLRKAMEDALPLSVPVEVDAKVGPNWNEMRIVSAPAAV